jgi:hypothetical protein
MDFSTILYVILIVGWFIFSIFKNMKKEEEERQAMKNRPRTVIVNENDNPVRPKSKKSKKSPVNPVFEEAGKEEYFTYETMSERDFENEFKQNEESENEVQHIQPTTPNIQLSMEEEEIYKGVVWSEILKRKY